MLDSTEIRQPMTNLFVCPADKFYYDATGNFGFVAQRLHETSVSDFSSYAFNGGNTTNSNTLGIAGKSVTSIKEPAKTVLVAEFSAFVPWSWHQPTKTAADELPMFNNTKNMVSFVDGHVSYIKSFWGGNNPPGSLALHHNPPAGYDYKWSGD